MIPNLFEATNQYWRQLNELDAAYQRGEVTIAEVDTRVAELMAELGQARRETLEILFASIANLWNQQKEVMVGATLVIALTYAWMLTGLSGGFL